MRRPFVAALTAALAVSGAASAQTPPAPPSPPAPTKPDAPAPKKPADDDAPKFDSRGRQISKPKAKPKKQKITLPKPLNQVAPDYPPDAKKQGLEGVVTLRLDIGKDGSVRDAQVFQGAGHGFDEAAVAAAKRLRFSPARKADGTPFRAIIKYRFAFKIEEKKVEPAKPTTGILRGKILIQGIGDPLAGATVKLVPQGGEPGSQPAPIEIRTDGQGTFSFPTLAPGRYAVSIESLGFEGLTVSEEVIAGKELIATYRLAAKTKAGALEVFVEGERPPREVTRRTIEKREIERIPGTNGDALRSVTSLPGVARPPAILGALLVRGSAPQDTLTFVDGVYVPLIYHFGGLSSVVPTELLSKIDFYPGNFSARYGRAMGGIVDAGIRSPRTDGYHGMAQIDLIDARLMAEGPIADGWSFAVAGRRSYFDAWLGPALESAGAGVTQAPVYYDYQAMVEKKWKRTSPDDTSGRFRVSFYGSDDALEVLLGEPPAGQPALGGNVGLRTSFQRVQIGYEHQLSPKDELNMQLSLARDAFEFGLASFFFDLEVYSIIGRAEYTRKLAKNAKVHVGLDMQGGQSSVSARVPRPPRPGQPPNTPFSTRQALTIDQTLPYYRPAGYMEVELTPSDRWRIVPGLRIDYARDTKGVDVSPRLNSRFDIIKGFPRTSVKGGIGMFHQPPQYQESVEPLGTAGINANRALHYGLGIEQEFTKQLELSVEGFYKQLDNIVVQRLNLNGTQAEYDNSATGYAAGAEVLLKYKPDDRFFGWLAYTISRSARQNGPDEEEYLVPWDQPHILTVLGSYRLGGGWEIGARFRLTSGNRFTPNVCNPQSADCDPTRINAIMHGSSGAYTPIRLGGINNERLPLFHQLDLRVDKRWEFAAWKLSAYLDVQNAYNNQNTEGVSYNFNFTARQPVAGIPILPSIGLRGEF